MRVTFRIAALGAIVLLLLATGCERKTTNEITQIVSPAESFYVGSDACQACHSTIYESFMKTGHPFKLNDAAAVEAGNYYPFSDVIAPPDLPWSNISMVIGGFWWKARYIDNDGYVYTGPNRQYNLHPDPDDPLDPEFVKYETDTLGTKPYNCGRCHTTGYKNVGNQDGKPGFVGTWALDGIQCERCHGPAGAHVDDPYNVEMSIDVSSEMCGACHVRGDVFKIPAKNGFIKHHEQWNEMYTTKHQALSCVTCHDPHKGLHPLNPERDSAIKLKCQSCHFEEAAAFENAPLPHYTMNVDCIDCHMAPAAKSASGDLANFRGDVASHLWRINTDPDAEMFTTDGKYANGYLTLEYSCKRCHASLTVQDLAAAAPSVHP